MQHGHAGNTDGRQVGRNVRLSQLPAPPSRRCPSTTTCLQSHLGAGQHLPSQLPGSSLQLAWVLHKLVYQAQLCQAKKSRGQGGGDR